MTFPSAPGIRPGVHPPCHHPLVCELPFWSLEFGIFVQLHLLLFYKPEVTTFGGAQGEPDEFKTHCTATYTSWMVLAVTHTVSMTQCIPWFIVHLGTHGNVIPLYWRRLKAIEAMNSLWKSLMIINQVRSHFLIDLYDSSFLSCPLLVIQDTTGLKHLHIGFTFKTQSLHAFFHTVYGYHLWFINKSNSTNKIN